MKRNAHLIIQTAFLGDCILTFPLVENLHKNSPDLEIVYLCRKGVGEFIKSCFPYVTPLEVIKSSKKSYNDNLSFISETFNLSTVFCVHQSFRSMRFAMKLKADKKIHFTNNYRKFLVPGVLKNAALPEALRISQQLAEHDPNFSEKLNTLMSPESDYISTETTIPKELKTTLTPVKEKAFDLPEKYVIIAPGSVWETKKWPAQKFASLAKKIKDELNYAVIVLGSPNEKTIGETIKSLTPSVINLIGQTSLIDCKSIISHSQAFVGNDSGLVHLAALFDLPSVAVFGPTHEGLGFRPWQNYADIASLNLPCSPCGKHGSLKCPIKTHECMKNLDVSLVFTKLVKMIDKKSFEESDKRVSQLKKSFSE
jgi:heptosyltransferase-2